MGFWLGSYNLVGFYWTLYVSECEFVAVFGFVGYDNKLFLDICRFARLSMWLSVCLPIWYVRVAGFWQFVVIFYIKFFFFVFTLLVKFYIDFSCLSTDDCSPHVAVDWVGCWPAVAQLPDCLNSKQEGLVSCDRQYIDLYFYVCTCNSPEYCLMCVSALECMYICTYVCSKPVKSRFGLWPHSTLNHSSHSNSHVCTFVCILPQVYECITQFCIIYDLIVLFCNFIIY